MRSVLILGARSPVALDHARRFAAQGWRVVVADSVPCRITRWSRAVHAAGILPSARQDLRAYTQALNRIIAAHRIDLVLPTCEEVFYLARCRERLPRGVRVLAPPFETLAILHSKWRFLDAARDCGIDVPESRRVTRIEEARAWAQGRPVVLKPEFSRFGVHVRRYPDGMPPAAAALAKTQDWVVQTYCRGQEMCSYSIVDRGQLRAHVTYRPLYRMAGSQDPLLQACEMPRIEAFVRTFARKMACTGQLSFDWIAGADGRCSVLECNPRAVSGVHLFTQDDALPAALMGEATTCVDPGAATLRMIGPVMLTAALAPSLRSGSLRDWWRDLRAAHDVIGVKGDRRPLLGGLCDLGSYARLAARERCSIREASTRDTEWDGEWLAPPSAVCRRYPPRPSRPRWRPFWRCIGRVRVPRTSPMCRHASTAWQPAT